MFSYTILISLTSKQSLFFAAVCIYVHCQEAAEQKKGIGLALEKEMMLIWTSVWVLKALKEVMSFLLHLFTFQSHVIFM
jgi:hypothetical protein